MAATTGSSGSGGPAQDHQDRHNDLEEQIASLEAVSRTLEPETTRFQRWAGQVVDYAGDYLDSFGSRKTWGDDAPGSGFTDYSAVSEEPSSLDSALSTIRQEVDGIALDAASGGHLAYIPGGGITPAALGDFLADIANNYAGVYYPSPGAVRMENGLIRWLADLAGFPDTAAGTLLSGGSLATMTAVAAARDRWDPEGNKDRTRAVVYYSEQTHHCVHKSIRMAGMGAARHRHVPLDSRFRMNVSALAEMIREDRESGFEPWLLVASAGTTDVGAVDPLDSLAGLAETEGLWYHVDAAYGGGFLLVPEIRERLAGIERADSLVIDPHKGFFLPYGTGVVIVRDGEELKSSNRYSAPYLQDAVGADDSGISPRERWMTESPADLSPELTRHFRGLRFWLPLKLFGLKPFRAGLAEKAALCAWFHRSISEAGFETGPEPQLSVCIYRFVPPGATQDEANRFNSRLLDRVLSDGRIFLSSTLINGEFWLRLAVLCFRSHMEHVRLAHDLLISHRDELLAEQSQESRK